MLPASIKRHIEDSIAAGDSVDDIMANFNSVAITLLQQNPRDGNTSFDFADLQNRARRYAKQLIRSNG